MVFDYVFRTVLSESSNQRSTINLNVINLDKDNDFPEN